jgi:gas vesicle protein
MGRLITALKWFAYGIGLGLLFAPRSGRETRAQIIQAVSTYASGMLNQGGQAARQASQKVTQAASQAQQTSDQLDPANFQVRESEGQASTYSGGPA